MRISSICQICDAPLPVEDIAEHAQAHRGPVRVIVAGKPKVPRRRPASGRNHKWRLYLPTASGGLGGVAGFLLFGTFLIALVCGVLAFVGMRRVTGAL